MSVSGSETRNMMRARRKRSMCAGSHGSRATRSSAMTRASVAWFAARYASVSCSCASYIGCSRPPSTQTSTSLSSAGICPGTRATKSCRLVAASWNSAVAVAPSTAASMHANVASAFDSANDHPSVDTSPRRDGRRRGAGRAALSRGIFRPSAARSPRAAAAASDPRPRCPRRGTRGRRRDHLARARPSPESIAPRVRAG